MVSHAHGSSDDAEAAEAYRNGYLLAILLGILLAGSLLLVIPYVGILQQTEAVTDAILDHLFWMALSLIPTVPLLMIKNFCRGKNRPWTVLWIMLGGVGLNIVLNYILIFGKLGSPALGLAGAGIATLIARMATRHSGFTRSIQSSSPPLVLRNGSAHSIVPSAAKPPRSPCQ